MTNFSDSLFASKPPARRQGRGPLGPPRIPPGRRPHAAIIGAGFGGLAAAIRLGARGYRVTLLERLDGLGGRAYVHRQDGFTFDAGPTIVTAPFLLDELWACAGRRFADDVTLQALEPFYRVRFHDGSTFEACSDPDAMRAEVARLSPGDVAGYERFMKESGDLYRVGFEGLAARPFTYFTDMLRIAPDLMRLRADRTVYGHVSSRVKDERLRQALSFHPLFVGGNPFSATAFYGMVAHLERRFGVHFVMGGTGALVTAMARLAEDLGATIRTSADVTEITTEAGAATGVRLASGERLRADIVVSNADVSYTYGALLKGVKRRRWTDKKLARARYSMGLFLWYFGVNRRYEDVPHHMILMGPRYRGLLNDIFKTKRLAEDFSVYLHRPTATDPSLAPPGMDAFYALSPTPHLGADDPVDWAEAAEPYRRRIAAMLEETVLPGLSDSVVSSKVATPKDFETRLLARHGAAFSLEPMLLQSAWFRPHNLSEEARRLYLVGAGAHPGAGLPGVLCSAKVLDEVTPDAAQLV